MVSANQKSTLPNQQVVPIQDSLEKKIEPTLKRYIVLILFCINSGNKAFQWIQIPASTEKVTYFYGVNNYTINACSVLFMVSFIILSWPACYIIEHIGIRKAVLLASFGTSVGSTIKCFSCYEEGIYLLFIGQILVSFSEQLIFSVPSRLVSVWFPDNQVSSAVAIAVFGNQFGVAIGFVIPQLMLGSSETKEEIGEGLFNMFLATASLSVFAFLGSLIFFDEAPKYPPGAARLKQIESEASDKVNKLKLGFLLEMRNLFSQVLTLLNNKNFLYLAMSFGINVGVNQTIASLLNQMLEPLWPNDSILVGQTGFIIVICGALSLPLWGKLLDQIHRYLFVNTFVTVLTIVSIIAYALTTNIFHNQTSVYLAAALYGISSAGPMVAGLELAVELTYPSPELVTSSIMNVMPQIFGSAFVFVGSYIVDTHGVVATNLFYLACLLLALILLLNINETLKRQNAVINKQLESDTFKPELAGKSALDLQDI